MHQTNTNLQPHITIKDLGSKFGTSVNGRKIKANEERELSSGDKFTMGTAEKDALTFE